MFVELMPLRVGRTVLITLAGAEHIAYQMSLAVSPWRIG
jgi:hypothetical protein